MSETKWTPGPWRHAFHPSVEEIQLAEHDKGTMRAIGDPAGHDLALTYGDCSKANAHLIAAAPELYATIESLLEDLAYTTGQATTTECSVGDCCGFFGDGPEPCVHINAQRVLAKARGDS